MGRYNEMMKKLKEVDEIAYEYVKDLENKYKAVENKYKVEGEAFPDVCLASLFVWRETPQGYDYWSNLEDLTCPMSKEFKK